MALGIAGSFFIPTRCVGFFYLVSTERLAFRSRELSHFDSDSGGERGAAIDALVGPAKLNGLDAGAYLRHIIALIAEHPVNRDDELLRWVVADFLHAGMAFMQEGKAVSDAAKRLS